MSTQLTIFENYSLKDYNTFGIAAKAKYFCEIASIDQLGLLYCHPAYVESQNKLLLGGGSNILFTKDYEGIVIHLINKGIRIYKQKKDKVFLSVAAGENWHDFVKFCISNNLAGVENLSLIPGTVGAAPIQNIGAYGVEVKDLIFGVDTVNIKNGSRRFIIKSMLKFGYRDSIFKGEYKNKYLITSVHFKLSTIPSFNVGYGILKETIESNGHKDLTIKVVSDAVIQIRESKLPNPAEIGNAGSFFKNPTIETSLLNALLQKYPEMPSYPIDQNHAKIPAGWLIEQCGWKGKKQGNCGVHAKQALVLVNYGNATGQEILDLAHSVINSVDEKFGISLHPEVNII